MLLNNHLNFHHNLLFHLLSQAPIPMVPDKSLGARKKSSTELDLTADDRSFIRVLSYDSDDSDADDDPPIFWPAFAAWEVEILHLVDRKDLFKLYGLVVRTKKASSSWFWYDPMG
ncbi:hypothetical protein Tco_1122252 [Tanacetum coccineum]|uniref:Uncharacterized protein n=1 Tax=Tanacetum coccineum TaxID=301880 RepID=A0ABQ5J2C0_9ASTR